MTTYYRCDGSVSLDPSGGSLCSTGWLVVDEPTFALVSQEQASDLIIAVVLLWGLVRLFSFLFSVMGVSK